MRIIQPEGRVVWSASDLKTAAECEFAWCRSIDAKLGRVAAVEEPDDAILARAAKLGDAHELRVLERLRDELGDEHVYALPKVSSADDAALAQAASETLAALRSDAELIFQAAFASEEFVGFADFLRRDTDGRWRVQDSKLARTARTTALMQLAAYVDQLDRLEIPRADEVDLLLGDGQTSTHRVDDLLPLFFVRRARLRALIDDRRIQDGAGGEPLRWGDDRGDLEVRACGRCATCEEEVNAARDLLMVARMRPVQRTKLRAAGITTIDELAAASDEELPPAMNPDTFATLRAQARLQVRAIENEPPPVEPYNPGAIHDLPRPDAGDIFFDFEGDPLYTEPPEPGTPAQWNLDYLFGWVDDSEKYTALWAHSFEEERRALIAFLDYVADRRQAYPRMHIYHYAPYETSHLIAMAARHGVGEEAVDALLREGVFVDLYPLVLRAVRIGNRSYSIKKLEPLYMGDDVRTSDVQKGDDSIEQYVTARALRAPGRDVEAQAILDDLADYNAYDCVSTRRLRNWLIEVARRAGVPPAQPDATLFSPYEPPPLAGLLQNEAESADAAGGGNGGLYRFAAAAISYLPREAKTFWQGHFQRLREPASMWAGTRDVVLVDPLRTTVRRDWSVIDGARSESRELEVRGEIAPGTTLRSGDQPYVLYAVPAPFDEGEPSRAVHQPRGSVITEVLSDGYVVLERAAGGQTWREFPIALTPPPPPRTVSQQQAIEEWATGVLEAVPQYPSDAATDILRRIPPRTRSGGPIPADDDDSIEAITRAVLDLKDSYLAVQGPPGTGKTYTGSRVIARLVNDHGFRVGVVAQSHAIVETLLGRVVENGVPASRVAKAPKGGAASDPKYTAIPKDGMAAFLAEHAGHGVVVGGTAWDFSNPQRIARGELDLLVIDEAGQFSLASTIAVAAGAKRLLLLGDPQQLPQVSQGTHPEPVDTSALGWVMDGAAVIPPSHGYFLSHTWRMHPKVAEPVSLLAYAGQLDAAAVTSLRTIDGVAPGLHPVPIRHRGNTTESPEEAEQVVRIVSELIGRDYTDAATDGTVTAPRPLTQEDFIVVTPYNAQKQIVLDALAAAGYLRIPVGTVDNFQGKEAVVSITTLAASSGRDAPRGSDFLLLQNRLNVAVSRAKCVAYMIYSPGLLDDLPWKPEGVVRLSAFARLVLPNLGATDSREQRRCRDHEHRRPE